MEMEVIVTYILYQGQVFGYYADSWSKRMIILQLYCPDKKQNNHWLMKYTSVTYTCFEVICRAILIADPYKYDVIISNGQTVKGHICLILMMFNNFNLQTESALMIHCITHLVTNANLIANMTLSWDGCLQQ